MNVSSLTSKENKSTYHNKNIQNDKAANHHIQVSGIIHNVQGGVDSTGFQQSIMGIIP